MASYKPLDEPSAPPPPYSETVQIHHEPSAVSTDQDLPPPFANHGGSDYVTFEPRPLVDVPIGPSLVIIHEDFPRQPLTRNALGPYPCAVNCPYCRCFVSTEVDYQPGICAWASFGAFLFFGLWCGCCLIPLCSRSFKDAYHRCPQCRTHLGTYTRC